jgi:hypothetical protein
VHLSVVIYKQELQSQEVVRLDSVTCSVYRLCSVKITRAKGTVQYAVRCLLNPIRNKPIGFRRQGVW